MKKKILITGAAGFIGFFTAKMLSEDEENVLTLADNLHRGRMDEDMLQLVKKKNVKFIECDLTENSCYLQFEEDYDYIYHFAALVGVKNVEKNPDLVLYINSVATLKMLEFAKTQKKLRKIIFSSTSEIYSGTLKHFGIEIPTSESVSLTVDDITSPRSTYAVSKMLGESAFFNYGTKYNIPFAIVRYHNVYGPRMGFAHVIPEMFVKIAKNSQIEVPSARHTRAFCYVSDAVEMTVRIAECKNSRAEIFHVGNEREEIAIGDLVKLIADTMDKKIEIIPLPPTPGSPERRCPSTAKVVEFTGYSAQIPLTVGVRECYDWYKDKLGNRYE